MSAGKTLVLRDIDHTLITIGGLSHDIYADAFRSATGQIMRQLADMTGRTERAIAANATLPGALPEPADWFRSR